MKLKLSDKQVKRIAKTVEGLGAKDIEYSDEELGVGDYAGDYNKGDDYFEETFQGLEETMQNLQEALSWFGNAMLTSLPEGVTVEDITQGERWQQLLSSLKYTVEVMEGKYR